MVKDIGSTLNILEQAIKVEQQGLDFYQRAEAHTRNAAGKAFFQSLINDEKKHEHILRTEYEKVKSGAGWVEIQKAMKEKLPELALFPKGERLDIPPRASDLDVIQIAIEFERRGHDMYEREAVRIEELAGKSVYQYLAKWEERHRALLEKALNQLSADGTWLLLDKEKPLLDGA